MDEVESAEATLGVLDAVLRGIGDEDQVLAAARPAVLAWRQRGVDGTVPFGAGEAPAAMMARILSLEFLVHAWDYAAAVGKPVEVPADASALDRLLAFTGRRPTS